MNNLRILSLAVIASALTACSESSDAAKHLVAPTAIVPTAQPSASLVSSGSADVGVSVTITGPDVVPEGTAAGYLITLRTDSLFVDVPLDVVVVIDASARANIGIWGAEKAALTSLVNSAPASMHIGIVQFADVSMPRYLLSQDQSKASLLAAINQLPFPNSGGDLFSALSAAMSMQGRRAGAVPAILLMTAGSASPDPCSTTIAQTFSPSLQQMNTFVFAFTPTVTATTFGCFYGNDASHFAPAGAPNGALLGLTRELTRVTDIAFMGGFTTPFTLDGTPTTDHGTITRTGEGVTWNFGQADGREHFIGMTAKVPFDTRVCPQSRVFDGAAVSYRVGGRGSPVSISVQSPSIRIAPCEFMEPKAWPGLTGTLGLNGWYTSDVFLHWNVDTLLSLPSQTAGCSDTLINWDTGGFTSACIVTSSSGARAIDTVRVKRDATAPVITPVISGQPGLNSWYSGDVHLSWKTTYGPSGEGETLGCEDASVVADTDGQTFTCKATSGAGLTSTRSVTIRRDTKVPVVTPAVSGQLGANGWYTGNVNVAWNTSYGASGAGASTGCTPTTLTTDTPSQTFTCTAKSAAGLSATATVTIKRDASEPVVTPRLTGTLGSNGWYTSDVNVSWSSAYGVSGAGASSGCTAATVSADTHGQTFSCTTSSAAGRTTTQRVTVMRDATRPAISFAAGGSFTVDQIVSTTCSATDAMSGIASSTCASASAPAYTFKVGVNDVWATATDFAGNATTASGSFTVSLTTGGVTSLIGRMVTGQNQKMLINRMKEIDDKVGKQNPALDSQIKNFLKELEKARQDGSVSAADAATLGRLVQLFQ